MFFGQQISWSSGSFCTFPDRDSQIRETTYFKHTSLFKYEVVLKILVSATNQIDHRSITVFEIYNSPRQFSWSMRIALDFTVFKTFIFTVKNNSVDLNMTLTILRRVSSWQIVPLCGEKW